MPIWVNSLMKNILYMFNQIYLRTPAGWNFHAVNDSKTSRARFPGIQAKIQGVGQDFAGLRLKPFGLNFPTEDSHGFPTILRKLYNWNSSLWTIYIYIYIYYMFSSWWSIKHARCKYYTLPWKCLRTASRHDCLGFQIASHMTFQRCKTTATERVVLLDFGTDSPMALQPYNRWKILQMTKSTRHETSSM